MCTASHNLKPDTGRLLALTEGKQAGEPYLPHIAGPSSSGASCGAGSGADQRTAPFLTVVSLVEASVLLIEQTAAKPTPPSPGRPEQ